MEPVWAGCPVSEALQREAQHAEAVAAFVRAQGVENCSWGSQWSWRSLPPEKVITEKGAHPCSKSDVRQKLLLLFVNRIVLLQWQTSATASCARKDFLVCWCTPGIKAALPPSCPCLPHLVLKKLGFPLASTRQAPSPRVPGLKFLQHEFCFRIFVRVWVLFWF